MDLMNMLLEANRFTEDIQFVFINEYKKLLDENELTSKQSIVLNILEKKQSLTMTEVAEIIGGTPSAASQFVQKLEQKQYVKREVNKENRREVFVLLDKKGESFFNEMKMIDEQILAKYFLQLPEEDIVTYHGILRKLHQIVLNGVEA